MSGPGRRRDARGGQAGVTLVEMVVTTAVMAILLALVGPTLISSLSSTDRLQRTQAAIDDAQFVSARLDRELRSAQCISSPAENASGNVLVFRTLANGTQSTVTYRVAAGQVTRQADLDPEVVLITNVGSTATAFQQLVTPLRTVAVAIPIRSANGGTFLLQTTIAGRNAWRSC